MGTFLKSMKEVKKSATDDLLYGLARKGGTVGAAFASNTLGKKLPEKVQKFKGPILMALGTLGDMFIKQPHAKALCQGIDCYGTLETMGLIMPAQKDKFGLAGIGNADGGAVDWDEIARKAEEATKRENMSGYRDTETDYSQENKNTDEMSGNFSKQAKEIPLSIED